MRETVVERRLKSRVEKIGGMCVKLPPVSHSGLPDRIVFLPDGRTLLVELKAPGGSVRPVQRAMFDRLSLINHPVVVLSSLDEVDDWIDTL